METKTLYRVKRNDGGISYTLLRPNGSYTEKFRLVAEYGKVLTRDGITFYTVIDTDSLAGWYEVDAPAEYLVSGEILY
jgi:hypothetical protein